MNHPKVYGVGNHPRILFSEPELIEIRKSLISHEFFEKADRFLTEKEFQVKYPSIDFQINIALPLVQLEPLPEAPGYVDFPYWTMYSRAIEERNTILSTAYALTKEQKYGSKVKEYLLALAKFTKWYEFPRRGAEGNLSNAHFTLAAAIGYDSIFTMLSQQEKEIVQDAILVKGLKPFEIDFDNQDSHNIIASKRVAMLIGAVSIATEKDTAKYLSNAFEYLYAYLEDRLISPEIEGLLYTSVAINHILMAAAALHRATGNDSLIRHPYFETFLPELFMYMAGNANKQSFVNFSDSFYTLDISYLMGMLAQLNQHPVASWYFNRVSSEGQHVLLNPRSMAASIAPGKFFKEQNSKVFPTIGWAAFRNGWDKKSHLLAFSASESAKGHNHYDQNNFVLHSNDEWLLTNPGYQDYVPGPRNTFTTGTIGHNSMLVNGNGQEDMGRSRILDWYLSPFYDYCAGDATAPYQGNVQLWNRNILHIDQAYFIIIDHVWKNNPGDRLTFLFHTTSGVFCAGKQVEVNETITGNQIEVVGLEAAASLYYCYPENTSKSLEQYPGAEEYGTYVTVEPSGQFLDETMITLIVPHADKKLASKNWDYQVDRKKGTISIKVDREDGKFADYILFAEDHQSKVMKSERTDFQMNGLQAWVCVDQIFHHPIKLLLINGTELAFADTQYLKADKRLNAKIEQNREALKYELELTEETFISIPCAASAIIIVNDLGYEGSKNGELKLVLPIGKNSILIKQQN